MEIKIRKHGNSLGATFPKELAAQVGMAPGDVWYPVVEADGTIVLRAYNPEFVEQMEALREIIKEDRGVFAALAK